MADKYLNLAGTKKLYDDLRARLVNAGGKVEGIESTKARTITSADAKEQYRTYWDHATTYGSGKPIDINWTLKNIPTTLSNPIITASHFADNKLVVGVTDGNTCELWISEDKGNTFRKSKFDAKAIEVIKIKGFDFFKGSWYMIAHKRTPYDPIDALYISQNLDTWTGDEAGLEEIGIVNCLAHDKVKEYACGANTSEPTKKAWIGYKDTDNQWKTITSVESGMAVNLNAPLIWICLDYFGGLGAALGTDGTALYTQDGINWTGMIDQLPGTCVTGGGSDPFVKFYASTTNGDFVCMDMTVPQNGWHHPLNIDKGNAIVNYITFDNGMLLVGTNDGRIFYSEDGTNFTASTTDKFTGKEINTINYLGDRWFVGTNSNQFGDCPLSTKSELVKFFTNVNEKLTVPEKYNPLSLYTKATGTFLAPDGTTKNLASIKCIDNKITLIADDGIKVEDNIDNIAGYNLIIDNLVLNLEPVVIINNLVNSNNNLPEADTSAIENEVKNKADKSYVDESITNAIGPINTTLDEINGEVL